jgi:hypothetical protein
VRALTILRRWHELHGKEANGTVFEITKAHLHFTWYKLEQRRQEPLRHVSFENQFGRQAVILDQPEFLPVPAQKDFFRSKFPADRTHYKCYRVATVLEAPNTPVLSLTDQFFDVTRNRERFPFYYCQYCVAARKIFRHVRAVLVKSSIALRSGNRTRASWHFPPKRSSDPRKRELTNARSNFIPKTRISNR